MAYKPGDKVHYKDPYDPNIIENGVVKEVKSEYTTRVVYHCDGDWENYANYGSEATSNDSLERGWVPLPSTLAPPLI